MVSRAVITSLPINTCSRTEVSRLRLRTSSSSMESSLELSSSLSGVSSLLVRCRTFKVLLIGDSAVGKTCLTHRLSAREFPRSVEATIGVDFRERLLEIHGGKIKLQLWDTAGQERFRKSMVQHYYRNVHAILFVYDVTCPASFRSIAAWIEECRQNSLGHEIPRFLVGNKSDLRDDGDPPGQVSQETARNFAKIHDMMFFETSAKEALVGRRLDDVGARQRDSVEDVVMAVGNKLQRQKTPTSDPHGGSFRLVHDKSAEKGAESCC